MTVTKRDNSTTPFIEQAIVDAIIGAMEDTGNIQEDLATRIAAEARAKFTGDTSIIAIQDFVEHRLMCSSRKDVARAYIEFRKDRDIAREMKSTLTNDIQGLMGGTDSVVLQENANKDAKTIPTK